MSDDSGFIHPYVPNAAPVPRRRLLNEIGVENVTDLYVSVPDELQVKGLLNLPDALPSEHDLRKHVEAIIGKNLSCRDHLNFCGAGCWQHYVPAICDEITGRGEFLTAYGGGTYSDHGKNQAMFEFQSLIGELVGLEVVGTPSYDMGAAVNSAVTMACRITGRRGVLLSGAVSGDMRSQINGFTKMVAEIDVIALEAASGLIDLDDLKSKLTSDIGAVYFENPNYFGLIESRGAEIAEIVHAAGALLVVGVDPLSLGVLAAPGDYGADIVCGQIQPLGIHMYAGGGCGGFIASRDEERFVSEYPMILMSIAPGAEEGDIGFAWSTMQRTSYDKRHDSEDYAGTTQWLWGIGAAVYLSLMGPRGMEEVGSGILQRTRYAAERINKLNGISVAHLDCAFFKEFIIDFTDSGKSVAEVNAALLAKDIFGGKDLSGEFPEFGQSALYCVTEIHGKKEIDRLVDSLAEVLS
ncbi:MAG: aminomethyl-transferring glycine dehydrogenase subunit GcvPA [Proteobacteria bacterium]|nr:aminomethyl-transferring glycine dehydrogenase subunit GcvPA [Pseudomonadota bacterium]MDA1357645.1 aminomethyl-transferring glycine dehydrogenase subunit GcvPA [Pseudomonadota bacterium]